MVPTHNNGATPYKNNAKHIKSTVFARTSTFPTIQMNEFENYSLQTIGGRKFFMGILSSITHHKKRITE
jgi:hypothetical protein